MLSTTLWQSTHIVVYHVEYQLVTVHTYSSISWVPTCDSPHIWRFYSDALLGIQASKPQYPTQLHYPYTELTSHCFTLLILNARLESAKYQFYESLVLIITETKLLISRTRYPCSIDSATVPGPTTIHYISRYICTSYIYISLRRWRRSAYGATMVCYCRGPFLQGSNLIKSHRELYWICTNIIDYTSH